jgi:hypothetical protein
MRRLLLLLPLLAACGAEDPGAVIDDPLETPVLPAAYSFDLRSTCGERSLIGDYRVWVEDDEVTRVEPDTDVRYVPTLLGLERLADRAEPGAEVEVERGRDGWITWLSIDHLPDAEDDEECYRVSGVTEAGADPTISCWGDPPGWPASAMEGGIEHETPADDIEAALAGTRGEMGIDGPPAGTWTAAGPGRDALVVSYDRTAGGLRWSGHGQCAQLAPVLPDGGSDWVAVSAPEGGLDRTTADLPVRVMENQCTGARNPLPFLHEPVVEEGPDRVVVSWTSSVPRGGATCPGNPWTDTVLHLDAPLGDRELVDGSTWPPTTVEEQA